MGGIVSVGMGEGGIFPGAARDRARGATKRHTEGVLALGDAPPLVGKRLFGAGPRGLGLAHIEDGRTPSSKRARVSYKA
jgi:hypothetical protein